MESIEQILLIVHIAGGLLGLVVGAITVILKKGTKQHRLLGIAFVYGMAAACISGGILSVMIYKPFLFMVAIFSGYSLIHGVRAMHFAKGKSPNLFDKMIFYMSVTAHVCFLLYGVIIFFQQGFHFIGFLSILFGLGGLALNAAFSNHLFHPPARLTDWIPDHIKGIMSAFIATCTAFSSTVLHELMPVWVTWTWPTLVFTPLIILWIKQQRQKYVTR